MISSYALISSSSRQGLSTVSSGRRLFAELLQLSGLARDGHVT